jgi:hypothetical protein
VNQTEQAAGVQLEQQRRELEHIYSRVTEKLAEVKAGLGVEITAVEQRMQAKASKLGALEAEREGSHLCLFPVCHVVWY